MRDGSDSNDSGRLTWTQRVLLAFLAVAGSVFFSWAFGRGDPQDARVATAIAIAAGASWPIFGSAILAVTRARPSVMAWADVCLKTMAPGIAVLVIGGSLRLLGYDNAWLIVVSVGISNITMLAVFALLARAQRMAPRIAILLWLLILDGFFGLVVWWWLK